MDNHYKTWKSFNNFYWPAHYLIDQNGIVREVHFGEGGYLETENAIRSLLHLLPLSGEGEETKTASSLNMTPETYLGYKRAASYPSQLKIERGGKPIIIILPPWQEMKFHSVENGVWRLNISNPFPMTLF